MVEALGAVAIVVGFLWLTTWAGRARRPRGFEVIVKEERDG